MISLGFSIGTLLNTGIPLNDRISFFRKLGCSAIELDYIKKERLEKEPLRTIDPELLKAFSWISLHAPAGEFGFKKDIQSKRVLEHIEELHKRHPLNLVIFHPDSIKDPTVFENFTFPVAIENMDSRKISYQDVSSVAAFFKQNPGWKMTLDLNHCYTNDHSMELAKEFFQEFGNRIAELHISGFIKLHEPLYISKKDEILAANSDRSLPMIVESSLTSLEGARKEYEYIMNYYQTN